MQQLAASFSRYNQSVKFNRLFPGISPLKSKTQSSKGSYRTGHGLWDLQCGQRAAAHKGGFLDRGDAVGDLQAG